VDVHLHSEADGSGRPSLVFAHGFGGSARNFGPQARAFRDRHRVVRYDARGHARSDAPDDPAAYSAATFVDDFARAVGADDDAVVGGLSMGAVTALRFALQHPVRALIVAGFPARTPTSYTMVANAFADAIERDGVEAAGERFVWGPESGLDPGAARFVRQGFLEHTPHGLAHTLRGVIAEQPAVADLVAPLAGLTVPALVVVGEHDRGSIQPSRELAEAIPNARLVVIPDAGHVVNLAQPARFNAALGEFLRDAAQGTRGPPS
jgi:pimeloyl-ACP methyl ester carboxylesterase